MALNFWSSAWKGLQACDHHVHFMWCRWLNTEPSAWQAVYLWNHISSPYLPFHGQEIISQWKVIKLNKIMLRGFEWPIHVTNNGALLGTREEGKAEERKKRKQRNKWGNFTYPLHPMHGSGCEVPGFQRALGQKDENSRKLRGHSGTELHSSFSLSYHASRERTSGLSWCFSHSSGHTDIRGAC